MNTLEELRASLASHAEDLNDQGLHTRAGAVHARVRRVRRQRRVALAGALAAVLAVAGVGVGLGSDRQRRSLEPTSPLAGHAISRQVDVAGFVYDLATTAESKPGDQKLTLTLPKSDRDRVISLVASGLGAGDATLFVGSGQPDYLPASGLPASYDAGSVLDRIATDSAVDVPVELSTESTHLTVRLRHAAAGAVVGLAVYDQATALPGGVSAQGMAFPQTVGDERLVTAAIGRQGDGSVSITFRGPLRNPDLESLCATGAKHIWKHVTDSATKGWFGGECGPLDPTGDANLGVGHGEGVPSAGYGPGRHTVTIKVFRHVAHRRDTAVDLADVHLALGLYDDLSPVRHVRGLDWDTRMLSGGRMWQLDRVVPYVEGRTRIEATSGPVMLGLQYAGRSSTCPIASGSNGDVFDFQCNGSSLGGPSATWGMLLMPGAAYTLSSHSADDDRRPGTGLRYVLIYRPAD